MLSYVANHSKQRKTTKVIKLQWIASIWCQNIKTTQNYKTGSNYNELHRFDVKTIKTFELGSKTFKITQNYKRNQITMNGIDLASERSKMLRYVVKHSKLPKTTKVIKLPWIASIWHQNDLKCWDTSQNYKSDQIITNCIDLTSKR